PERNEAVQVFERLGDERLDEKWLCVLCSGIGGVRTDLRRRCWRNCTARLAERRVGLVGFVEMSWRRWAGRRLAHVVACRTKTNQGREEQWYVVGEGHGVLDRIERALAALVRRFPEPPGPVEREHGWDLVGAAVDLAV